MNHLPDVELVLRDYLADTTDRAPDRVLVDVAARIARQPRRRTWRLQGRPFMNSYAKLAAAAAAVLVVGIVGWQLLPGRGGIGGQPTPVPTPFPTVVRTAAAPSAAASASAVFPAWYTPQSASGAGILPAGSGTTRSFLRGSTFVVPANWVNDTDTADFFGLFPDTPANEAEFAVSGDLAQGIVLGIVDTPSGMICEGAGNSEGSTAAELADSLVAETALVTSEPVDVTIGDLTGTRVDSHLDPGWTGTCTPRPGEPPTRDYKDIRARFVFLDLPDRSKLSIIISSLHAAEFETLLAEAMPIVESFAFDVP